MRQQILTPHPYPAPSLLLPIDRPLADELCYFVETLHHILVRAFAVHAMLQCIAINATKYDFQTISVVVRVNP